MTYFLLVFIGILIGLLIQAALDYKMLCDMGRDIDRMENEVKAFLEKRQEVDDDQSRYCK